MLALSRRYLPLALLLGLLVSGPLPARAAQEASAAAVSALQLARYHYERGDFAKAAPLFLQAWEIDPKPDYLFNAARAEQRGMLLEDAEKHYRALLGQAQLAVEVKKRATLHLGEVVAMRQALARAEASGRDKTLAELREKEKAGAAEAGKELAGMGQIQAKGPEAAPVEAPKGPEGAPGPQGAKVPGAEKGPDAARSPEAARAPEPAGPPKLPKPALPPGGAWKSRAAPLALGSGVVLAALGAWLAVSGADDAAAAKNAVPEQPTQAQIDRYNEDYDAGRGKWLAGLGVAGLGAVALGAGAWMWLTAPEDRGQTAFVVLPAPAGGLTVNLDWRF